MSRPVAALAAVLAAALVSAPAASATSFTVSVQPPGPGTAAAPKPQSVDFDLSNIRSQGNNRPTAALLRVVEQLPADFRDQLALFATCPASAFANLGPKPPPCPPGSKLGTAAFSAYVPSLFVSVTTDAGYLYNAGGGHVRGWVHVSRLRSDGGSSTSIDISIALTGQVLAGTATTGPSVSWDLSPAVNMGVEARISHFATDWAIAPAAGGSASTARASRKAARTPHRKRKRKSRRKPPHHKTAAVSAASAFESTGCGTGSWPFSATAYYRGGSSESLTASVSCGSGASAPPAPPGRCLSLPLSICIPLPAARGRLAA